MWRRVSAVEVVFSHQNVDDNEPGREGGPGVFDAPRARRSHPSALSIWFSFDVSLAILLLMIYFFFDLFLI